MINRLLVQSLLPNFHPLPFRDRLAGLVKTIEKKDYAGKGKRLAFPASHDLYVPDLAAPLKPTEYTDLSPNSNFKSVVFFEDHGCNIISNRGGNWEYESTIRLVAWVNYQQANTDELRIVHELLGCLPSGFTNAPGMTKIQITPMRVLGQEERIFSRYAFDEAARQYLMLPYLACAIELKIKFSVNPLCLS